MKFVSILILLDTGWKKALLLLQMKWKDVSILILLDTGWKSYARYQPVRTVGFNPHLTGYGLEVISRQSMANFGAVSILILLDTGWKFLMEYMKMLN